MLGIITGGGNIQDIFIGLVAILLAMVSALTVHEFAHAYAAKLNGDLTAKFAGRMTLNPAKHLDFLGTLALLLIGFGWAKPVPINPNNFKKYRKGVVTVSLAGVLANLLLALINLCIALLTCYIFVNTWTGESEVAYVIFKLFYNIFMYGMLINLTLMAFNLLPIYPLDGFHVVEIFAKPNNAYCRFMYRYGQLTLFALLIGGGVIASIGRSIGGMAGKVLTHFDVIGMYIYYIQEAFTDLFEVLFNLII